MVVLAAIAVVGGLAVAVCVKVVDVMCDPSAEMPRMPVPVVIPLMFVLLLSIPFLWVAVQLRGGSQTLQLGAARVSLAR
ncbi:MAG: hypothetical protein IT307_03975 [Chloroflexi bacterium]|nr:hypothetical protein [Chloroflexota bacterium]